MKKEIRINNREEGNMPTCNTITVKRVDSIQDCLNRLSTAVENLTEVLKTPEEVVEEPNVAEECETKKDTEFLDTLFDTWNEMFSTPEKKKEILRSSTQTSDQDIADKINTIISGLTFTTRG